MKPKTKMQFKVAELAGFIPESLTTAQKDYAFRHCFEHYGYQAHIHQNKTVCMDCLHVFNTDKKRIKCPKCGQTLEIVNSRKRTLIQDRYFCVVDRYSEFQILRFFYCSKISKIGKYFNHEFTAVVQHWFNSKGSVVTRARLPIPCSTSGKWKMESDLEIRARSRGRDYRITPDAIWSKGKVIPVLKRNGFKGSFHGIWPLVLFEGLLSDNKFEILFKAGQFELLKYFSDNDRSVFFRGRWNQIKICIRHNYIVEDPVLWLDHISTLEYLNKDITNPVYICPSDLHLEHTRLTKKRREIERQVELELQKKSIEKDQKLYEKQKKKFFGVKISDGVIDVVVLDSVKEFIVEGDIHEHCVYTNEYYKNKNSLIMSARIGEKRIETVEIDLKKCAVVQSRGYRNTNTEYHDRIVELVNRNMSVIRNRKRRQLECANA